MRLKLRLNGLVIAALNRCAPGNVSIGSLRFGMLIGILLGHRLPLYTDSYMLAGIRTRDLRKIYTSPPPLASGGGFGFGSAREQG